jgi:hypothetical protein
LPVPSVFAILHSVLDTRIFHCPFRVRAFCTGHLLIEPGITFCFVLTFACAAQVSESKWSNRRWRDSFISGQLATGPITSRSVDFWTRHACWRPHRIVSNIDITINLLLHSLTVWISPGSYGRYRHKLQRCNRPILANR